jgi:hypothetical protein
MLISMRWKSNIAALTAMGMVSTLVFPMVHSMPAIAITPPLYNVAQLFRQSRVVVPSDTTIQVRYDEAERIIVMPDETVDITLTVATSVRSAAGTTLIPAGSTIEGQLRPTSEGTQFFSSEIVFPSGQRYQIDAASDPITETETITRRTSPDILRGAAIGAAAAAVLAEIFGSIDLIEVIAGAGLGALGAVLIGGRRESVEVVVVEPETDLDLTLQSNFEF